KGFTPPCGVPALRASRERVGPFERYYQLFVVGLVLGVWCWPTLGHAQPELPVPKGTERVGAVMAEMTPEGQSVGAVLYLQNDRNYAGEAIKRLFLDVLLGTKGGEPRRRVLRREIPKGFADDYRYLLKTIDLQRDDQRWVLRFEADPDKKGLVSDRDRYVMVLAGGARELALISAGRQDGIDPKQLVSIEDIDKDGDLDVIQIDTSRAVATCGDTWEKLFPLVWDFKASRFKPAPLALALDAKAGRLRGAFSSDAPISSYFPKMLAFRTSSSDFKNIRAAPGSRLSRPTALSNHDLDEGWTEGAPGYGLGEFVTAQVNPGLPIQGIRIVPGLVSSEAQFVHNAMPKQVLLSFEDGSMVLLDLPQADRIKLREQGGLYVELPQPVVTDCLTVTILDVWPPKRKLPRRGRDDGAHTSLTEVTVLSTLDYLSRPAAIQAIVELLLSDISTTRRRAIERIAEDFGREMTPTIMAAQEVELAKPIADAHPERLIAMLNLLDPDDALVFIEKLLDYPGLRTTHLATLQRNVAFKGRVYIEPLFQLTLDDERSERVRANAAHIVSRAGPSQRMLELTPLLGNERADLRKSVVRGLARAGFGAVDALLDIAADPDSTAIAAHDALWAIERIIRSRFRGEPGSLKGGERIMTSYTQHDDVQLKLRALRLLRTVRVNNGDAFLATVLESDTLRPELHALAAEGLTIYTTQTSTDALLSGLKSPSPSVRIQCAKALNSRPSLPRVTRAIIDYVATERWTRGLRYAYANLAQTETSTAQDVLYSVAEGSNAERATLALKAINTTRSGALVLRLKPIVLDTERPDKVRRQAIKALAWTEGTAGEAFLVELVRNDNSLPIDLLEIAIHALGTRRSPRVVQTLLEVAADPEPVEAQRAAIRVLAYFPGDQVLQPLQNLLGRVDKRTERTLKRTISSVETRDTIRDTRGKVKTIKGLQRPLMVL
ncbi:MAG: HEAT repeat domain-containing protein, partial [Myxococcota bacterium]